MKSKSILPFLQLLAIVIFTSCDKNDDGGPTADTEIIKEQAEVTASYEEVDNIIIFAMQSNGLGLKTALNVNGDYCANTQTIINEGSKTITVDFGQGCTSPNGINRKGKIILTYSGNFLIPGTIVNTTFEGYEVNGKLLEGTRKVTNKGFDPNGTFIILETTITNGKVTWSDNTSATITLRHDRKIYFPTETEGLKIEITGDSSGKSRNGFNYSAVVATPLIFLQSCTDTGNWVPSSGILEILVENNQEFSVNYGSGTCDKNAVVNFNGQNVNLAFD